MKTIEVPGCAIPISLWFLCWELLSLVLVRKTTIKPTACYMPLKKRLFISFECRKIGSSDPFLVSLFMLTKFQIRRCRGPGSQLREVVCVHVEVAGVRWEPHEEVTQVVPQSPPLALYM